MSTLSTFLRATTLLFLGATALIVAGQLLTGRIRLQRLLNARGRRTAVEARNAGVAGRLSLSRGLSLVVSAGVALYVLAATLLNPEGKPEIPPALPVLAAASQVVYLAGKRLQLRPQRTIPSP